MSKLYLTTCFHGNLGYSSIPETKFKEVIDKCYWPIISLVEKLNLKLGFEFSARTLEIIKELDENLLLKIKQLWVEKKIEIVGSGYVQSIFSLIPAEVNMKNLEIGNKVYQKLLGKVPEIAYVNEQVYSKGLIKLYKKAGYKTIIIDWVNSLKSNAKLKECKFSTTKIKGGYGESINVVWNNTILFQKLQKYVYGDLEQEEYLDFVKSHYSDSKNRCLMLYGNDMEVFDFRPRNPKALHSGEIIEPEIKKIELFFEVLKNLDEIEFVLPSETLNINYIDKVYDVGSSDHPIITKKQDKYNVVRWAVCGKNNYLSNSLCYKAYKLLMRSEIGRFKEENWKKLVKFWASDFRTYTEEGKWIKFRTELNEFINELTFELNNKIVSGSKDLNKLGLNGICSSEVCLNEIEIKNGVIETDNILLKLSDKKGGTIKELIFKKISEKPLIRTIPQGFFDEVSYSVDFFSGHTIIFDEKKQKTDLSKTQINVMDLGDKIRINCKNDVAEIGIICKDYYVYKHIPKVDLIITFELFKEINPLFVRTGIITLNPEAFNQDSLYYATKNGGFDKEIYFIKENIDQVSPLDMRITAKHCLGTTNEELEIGDEKIKLIIKTDKSETYSVPLLKFENLNDGYILRIFNSIIEHDETSNTFFRGKNKLFFSYEASRNEKNKI